MDQWCLHKSKGIISVSSPSSSAEQEEAVGEMEEEKLEEEEEKAFELADQFQTSHNIQLSFPAVSM